ncbi:MAG: 50S ribosomal protein L5 [Bacteriovoracaceae bacterium]|nr:50S ribosomal protein L5 [Bacteriovoracaceae bacterium]
MKELYNKTVRAKMSESFKYKNTHQVPKLTKIVLNCVTRDAVANSKVVDMIKDELTRISGQTPVIVRAKKSIASFKLREDQAMGASVTLRGDRMYEFFDRLVTFALPRVKDFRGVSVKGFDSRGNYTLGLKEQIIFPEIDYDKIDKTRGIGICFVTTAETDNEGRELLRHLGMPFREN